MSGKPDEKSEMMIEDKQEIQGKKSSISKSRILFLILVVIAFVVLIIGIVLIALSFKKRDCAQNDDGEEKQQAQVSGEQTLSSFCEYSEEAKRIGLHDILVRAKKSYYEYNPFLLTSDPDATRDEFKEKYTAYTGADPGFFSEGGALVSFSTSTPINNKVFFLQNTNCIRKPQVISEGGGVRTPCTLPLDPPLLQPKARTHQTSDRRCAGATERGQRSRSRH